MTTTDTLPNVLLSVTELTALPVEKQALYESHPTGYKLSSGGRLLNKVRAVTDSHHSVQNSPQSIWGAKPAEIALSDWSRTISAASADQRRSLLWLAANGRVAVKR